MHILFQHRFDYPIWRLVPSETNNNDWVIELRDKITKRVDYYFLDNSFSLSKLHLGLDWWTGIESVSGDYIIFHHYLQQDLPIHKGISVYHTKKNEWAWQNDFVTFLSIEDEIVTVTTSLGSIPQTIYLKLSTGEDIPSPYPPRTQTATPATYQITGTDAHISPVTEFVQRYTSFALAPFFEYFESEQYIICSYYVKTPIGLDNYLLATDSKGEEILHVCLSEQLKGFGTGTFSVSNGFLSFVKDKNELYILGLS